MNRRSWRSRTVTKRLPSLKPQGGDESAPLVGAGRGLNEGNLLVTVLERHDLRFIQIAPNTEPEHGLINRHAEDDEQDRSQDVAEKTHGEIVFSGLWLVDDWPLVPACID